MAKKKGRYLSRPQNNLTLILISALTLFSESAAAWYQLNLFKDREDWWTRPDITSPAEIMVREGKGYACNAANRPIDDTAMDMVVIWNRPEVRGTVVKAVAFYEDEKCGSIPDPITGELPLPSVILVLSLDNPNAISMFNFKIPKLEFLWGSYRAFDLAAERNPKRIVGQFAGENLSGTMIQKDPNPVAPDKPYKAPVRIMRVLKENKFQSLTRTADINAIMRHAGETSQLSDEEAKTPQVSNMTKLLLGRIFQSIEEERMKGEEIRRRLAATSAAAGGSDSATIGTGGTDTNPDSVFGGQSTSQSQMPNLGMAQMPRGNPNSMDVPPPGSQLYPTYNPNVQTGQTSQNPTRPSGQQGTMTQQYPQYGNFPGQQGGISQSNAQQFSTPPLDTAQQFGPRLNGGNNYPSTMNRGSSLAPGTQYRPNDYPTGRVVADTAPNTGTNENSAPNAGIQEGSRPQSTYILPRLGPVKLHPELATALAQGDDPRMIGSRPVDLSAILQSYYMQPDKERWRDTYKAFVEHVKKLFGVVDQLYTLGEQGKVPPLEYAGNAERRQAGGGSGAGAIQQAQSFSQSSFVNQPPGQDQYLGSDQPSINEIPQSRPSQSYLSQQRAAFDEVPNTEGHHTGQMQMEVPQQEFQASQQAQQFEPTSQNPPSQRMVIEGEGIERLSVPGVFRLGVPRRDEQSQSTSQPPGAEGELLSNQRSVFQESLDPNFEYQGPQPSDQQLGQGSQNFIEYVPSPNAVFPDWGEDFALDRPETSSEEEPELAPPPPRSFTIADIFNRQLEAVDPNDNNAGASTNIENIPAMFQRGPSGTTTVAGGQAPSQNNQLYNSPSVGQLRPIPGSTGQSESTRSPYANQIQNIELDQREYEQRANPDIEHIPNSRLVAKQRGNSVPFRIERFPPRPVQDASVLATGDQAPGTGEEGTQGPIPGPEVFNREGELRPESFPSQYIEEYLPVAANLELGQGEGLDRRFREMVRDMVWGKPSVSEESQQPSFPGAHALGSQGSNPVISDEVLLRPPPIRQPPEGLHVTGPNPRDLATAERGLAQSYANLLSQLRRQDYFQRQPNAERTPGYITPQFLQPPSLDPMINPFLEEDNSPPPPSLMMENLNPDLTRQQIWDTKYDYTDPMLDRDFALYMLQQEREERDKRNSDPFREWRTNLKSMVNFQQRRRARPQDIPYWSMVPTSIQGRAPSTDNNRALTQQAINVIANPQNFDAEWNEAENSLVIKKMKPNTYV
ncbi:hypothetical protein TWF718_005109 [Orbilia javanica]|uniref:Uncharacterized protein n=1 Tax=Orbilia javanica TaxID=47235 RepID=A0AAN8N790_9PEZI